MMQMDILIKNGQVFFDDKLREADILVKNGTIAEIIISESEKKEKIEEMTFKDIFDAKGCIVIPGTIDPHVHIRAPGYEEREDFFSGTQAAAAGGVTTIIEQPLANPPQYSLEILDKRIAVADEASIVDFAFYGAAGSEFPEKIEELANSGKVVAFKTFLHEAPKGRDSEFLGLTMKNAGEQYRGMGIIGELGVLCGVHAENNDMINEGIKLQKENGNVVGVAHALSRPPISEYETVSKLLLFAEVTGARIEFCHISTPEAMEMIKRGKEQGLDIYLETCPHYLFMDESLLEKHGPFAKCNPPLRDKCRVEKLWNYINDGTVDFIGSDHAPYTYDEKIKGFENIFNCPSGIPCIEMRLPLMIDAVYQGRLSLARMIELICTNPARIFGLYPRKGIIEVGADADFVIIDPKESYVVRTVDMYTKCRDSAGVFDGMELTGKIKMTIVRGNVVMCEGIVDEHCRGYGKFIKPHNFN